jgi:hypothetical protein
MLSETDIGANEQILFSFSVPLDIGSLNAGLFVQGGCHDKALVDARTVARRLWRVLFVCGLGGMVQWFCAADTG